MRTRTIIAFALALFMLPSVPAVAQVPAIPEAQQPETQQDAIGQTPPRLSLTKGEVSFWRPGAQDWAQAQINIPLAPGDQLYTGPQGNLEIQIGPRAFVRGGANTQMGLENLEPDFVQFKVTAGNASFDLRTVEPGRTVEVDTPNAAFTIEHAGYYRVDVSGDRTSFITRRSGQATVTASGGQSVAVEPSEDVVIQGNDTPQVASYAAPQLDAWDKWNYARTDHLLDAVSARYVSPGVYGVDDLDRYGKWRSVPEYGQVWVPSGVPADWAPYSTGSWVQDPYYGWTWVSAQPWGWAPYHYGRWVHVNGFWAWAPGPVVVRPAYAPALVAFLGGGHVGVGVGIGAAGLVGWVALGWGEPCVPWWGPESFRHHPWWGGWGGPRFVNDRVINRTTVVNVQEINVYRNAGVRNAVVAVNENHFGRGPVRSTRVAQVNERALHPIHAAPQIAATPSSFVPRESRGVRPPERVLQRSVVATRTPHLLKEASAGATQKGAPLPAPTPAPRIVSVPQKNEPAAVPQRPAFGQSNFERRTNDRARPPAPPRVQNQGRPEQAFGATPSVTHRAQPPQRGAEVASPSPAAPQSSGPRTSGDERTRPSSPPKFEGQRQAGQAPSPAPSVAPQAQPQRQRGPQAAAPSPVIPQPSARSSEVNRARPPRVETQRRAEQAHGAAPPVTPQAAAPRQSAPHVAVPSPARPPAVARPSEAARPSTRVLPGEPANRLSPNRASSAPQNKGQQHKEQQQHKEGKD